jgi:hypothetical protein
MSNSGHISAGRTGTPEEAAVERDEWASGLDKIATAT